MDTGLFSYLPDGRVIHNALAFALHHFRYFFSDDNASALVEKNVSPKRSDMVLLSPG